jgi:cyclophilin family peptidyl-prolyl cis-trans isomerase
VLRRLFNTRSLFSKAAPPRKPFRHLRLEFLEGREVPSVTIATISQPTIPDNKPIFIPVNITSTPAGDVTTTVSSDNPNVAATVVTGGESVRFDVTGTDSNGVPFSGSITIRLFTDSAPNAAQRIIDLVNSGYYTGKLFPRVLNNFVIQGGGSSTSDNSSLPSFADEFNAAYTFDSPGVLAMANSGDDTNNSQFFITDPADALSARPTSLNFNYSIVGIMTSGFDIYQKIATTAVVDNGSGEVSSPTNPITITGATVFSDTTNAVIELNPNSSFGTGTADITVISNDGTTPTTQTFTTAGVNDGVDSPPFITTPIPDQTTTAGVPVTFSVPVTDINGDSTTLAVEDTTFTTTTIANATVSIDQTNQKITITPTAGFTGTIQFKVGVRATSATDTAASYDTQLVTLTVNAASTSTPTTPTTGSVTATGSPAGSAPTVTVLNADGTVRFTKTLFDPSFTGGVRVAVGDVNGDGVPDIIAVPGYGGSGVILVLDSTTGDVFRTITLFANDYRGGLFVAAGDPMGLGYDQVLVGAGNTGGPRVNLLDLKQNKVLLDFYAGLSGSRGGVGSLSITDVFKNQGQDVVAGSGVNSPPAVYILSATTGQLIGDFAAPDPNDPTDQSGVRATAGDQDATTGVRPIFAAPLSSADGTIGTQYDPSQYMDPTKPIGSSSLLDD